MKRSRNLLLLGVLAGVAVLLALSGFVRAAGNSTGSYCSNCHEIRPSHATWAASAHREMACKECHGTLLGNGLHSLRENALRAFRHVQKAEHDHIALDEGQVLAVMERCRNCHRQQAADWKSSGHSMTYASVFLNPAHNRVEQINDDCLRCHGMFFRGTVREIVAPLSTQGPWTLRDPALRDRAAIPCLACHRIHMPGDTAQAPDYENPRGIGAARESRARPVAFYDRREETSFSLEELPTPRMVHKGQPVLVSPDPRERLCTQCHAPNAWHTTGTGDDRTPRGVHEGLSCLACHATHALDAKAACRNCHPALSNCGLEVTKMDTTLRSANSPHNIHTVACVDCHPKGRPSRR